MKLLMTKSGPGDTMLLAFRKLFISLSLLLITACSQEPDDPGLCSLSCNKAIIGPTQGVIETKPSIDEVVCGPAAAGQVIDPMQFNFVITESVQTDAGDQLVPLQSVSIEPIVTGPVSSLPEHNVNVQIDGDTFTPIRYKGIATPSSNWCTDTCGVSTLEVASVCPAPGVSTTLSVGIHSGSLFSEPATVTISTEE